ncbi:large ribosomal subunit protein bL35m-like [Lasioglossum baleicum]|uniref:large ribosomal subunit protein bL35m-like n=1 Tax=Lasioglossum baleicum TaxID=434251 RepID=UPI003FCEB79A
MLRIVSTAVRGIVARANVAAITNSLKQHPLALHAQNRYFGALSPIINRWNNIGSIEPKAVPCQEYIGNVLPSTISPSLTPVRTITKFSRRKGKRKTCKAVLKRFYRLNWGMWIRTKAGRHSKLWKKKESRKRRLRQHVFTNATQSFLLDKMVTKYWRRPHYYPEDPYNPYHTRDEFPYSRRKPIP